MIGVLFPLLAHQPVTVGSQLIDLREHPAKQLLRRGCADPSPLKGLNVLPLPMNLAAHVFDFGSDGFKLHQIICS